MILWRLGDGGDVGVALEIIAQGAAEDAHAGAVDDADAGQPCEEGAVDEPLDLLLGLVGGTADDVNLGRGVVGVAVLGGDGDATAASGRLEGSNGFDVLDLGNVFDGSSHLHRADGDLEDYGGR